VGQQECTTRSSPLQSLPDLGATALASAMGHRSAADNDGGDDKVMFEWYQTTENEYLIDGAEISSCVWTEGGY
jgi:hypothetical protein